MQEGFYFGIRCKPGGPGCVKGFYFRACIKLIKIKMKKIVWVISWAH